MAIQAPTTPTVYWKTTKPFPTVYAVTPHGDCMSPEYEAGEPLIIDSTAKPTAGDTVIIHIRPEFVQPGQFDGYVKRLRDGLWVSFPWNVAGSDIVPCLTVEQLNPRQILRFPWDKILAVHKVIGKGARYKGGAIIAPHTMLKAA